MPHALPPSLHAPLFQQQLYRVMFLALTVHGQRIRSLVQLLHSAPSHFRSNVGTTRAVKVPTIVPLHLRVPTLPLPIVVQREHVVLHHGMMLVVALRRPLFRAV